LQRAIVAIWIRLHRHLYSDSCSDKRKPDGKDQVAMLKAAKDNAEEQITFLNLVIVEREKKFKALEIENESLRNKMKILESQIP